MKKLFFAVLVSLTVVSSAFAKDTKKVSAVAASNFKAEFVKATDVNWTTTDQYIKASFVMDNEKREVYYNPSGEKIASSRTISIDELPVKAKRSLAKSFSNYTIKEAIEFEGTEDSGYFVSLEDEKESLVLKVGSLGGLSTFKTIKK
jgi:hypothetical protein